MLFNALIISKWGFVKSKKKSKIRLKSELSHPWELKRFSHRLQTRSQPVFQGIFLQPASREDEAVLLAGAVVIPSGHAPIHHCPRGVGVPWEPLGVWQSVPQGRGLQSGGRWGWCRSAPSVAQSLEWVMTAVQVNHLFPNLEMYYSGTSL